MNELVIMFILSCFILISFMCAWVFANLCWVLHRKAYNGKMSRARYVKWFFNNVY